MAPATRLRTDSASLGARVGCGQGLKSRGFLAFHIGRLRIPHGPGRKTLGNDTLTIDAERTEGKSDRTRSEFQYIAFRRAMALPAGARVDDISANYADGILTVSIGRG